MSLVVAEATESGPLIVSDTRVVDLPEGEKSSFKTGTLKAIVVSRDVTICFAGDVKAGLDGVRMFARQLHEGSPVDALVPRLQELTSDKKRVVEFIVATREALIRIRDGAVEPSLSTAWIGDQQAFERFQRARHEPLDELGGKGPMPVAAAFAAMREHVTSDLTPPQRAMLSLRMAMQAVIDDPTVDSVADFCVAVAYKPSGFEYLGSIFIHVGRDISVQGDVDLISVMAQPVEEGGYAVSVVEPAEPGTPALGLSFPRGRLGMLYLPL